MRSDSDIKSGVEAELRCHPDLDESCIAVNVAAGTVTLMGYVRDFFQKYGAEDAVKRVAGVAAVANVIQVRALSANDATDPQIARACLASIRHQVPYSWEQIRPVVRQGIVTLEGTVATDEQRTQAETVVCRLKGVLGVINALGLSPVTTPDLEWIRMPLRQPCAMDASPMCVASVSKRTARRSL
jgi:osmotically-inducible protein OsmY